MDVFNHWYCLGKFVGLLRAGVGRLVVLGSSRKRIIHAMADRHRVDPFPRGYRKTRGI